MFDWKAQKIEATDELTVNHISTILEIMVDTVNLVSSRLSKSVALHHGNESRTDIRGSYWSESKEIVSQLCSILSTLFHH